MPGEFRDVDVPGGAIRDSIAFLPYKEPSSVLYQLLGNIVEEGRRIGSVADVQVGNLNPQAPVGTTLALMERSMKVMSGVQARLHASLKNERRLLAKVIKDNMDAGALQISCPIRLCGEGFILQLLNHKHSHALFFALLSCGDISG